MFLWHIITHVEILREEIMDEKQEQGNSFFEDVEEKEKTESLSAPVMSEKELEEVTAKLHQWLWK